MFDLEPSRVTKEMLLKSNSEEAYMSFYLGVNPTSGLFCSPLRADKNPTCAFYRTRLGELRFKDFNGSIDGDFVKVVMHIHGVNYNKALNMIANDFNIVSKTNYVKNEAKIKHNGAKIEESGGTVIQCELEDFNNRDISYWNSFGIQTSTLSYYGVFKVKSVFLNGNYLTSTKALDPIYGYYFGKKDNVEQWKIYFPKRSSYRFLLNTDVIQGFKQLPERGRFLVITKSLKDVMTLYELGVPAIAPQSENLVLSSRQVNALANRFEYIITNGDWDDAGRRFMQKSRRAYKTICLSFTNPKEYGKDLSDYVKKFGIDKARALVKNVARNIVLGRYDYQFAYCEK